MELFSKIKNFFIADPQPTAERTGPLLEEMASYRSPFYPQSYENPYNPDALVKKKGGLKIYETMRQDDCIKAVLFFKKNSLVSPGYRIEPASEDDLDVEVAQFVEYCFTEGCRKDLKSYLMDTLTAWEFGFSIQEIIWEYFEGGDFPGKVGIKELKSRPPHSFEFHLDEFGNVDVLKQNSANGTKDLPLEKFIIYSNNPEFGNPYGTSDLRACYRSWWSKENIIKFWNIFLERFGMPTAIGKYSKTSDKTEKANLKKIVSNLQSKTGVTIPDDMVIELLEATRAGAAGYDTALNRHDGSMARALLVPDLLGVSNETDRGSRSLGETQFKGFIMALKRVGDDLEEEVTEQLIVRLVDMNYKVKKYPKLKFNPLTEEDKREIFKVWLELIKNSVVNRQAGDENYIRKALKMPELTEEAQAAEAEEIQASKEAAEQAKAAMAERLNNPDPNKEDPNKPDPKDKGMDKMSFFKMKRAPNKYEGKMNFSAIVSNLDSSGNETVKDLEKIIGQMRDQVVEAIKKNYFKDFKGVQDYNIKYFGDFRLALKLALRRVFQDGAKHARGVLKSHNFAVKHAGPGLSYNSALDYFDQKSFAITGIEKTRIEAGVKQILSDGLKNGWTTKETVHEIERYFDPYFYTPELPDEVAEPWRLETIVRTNFAGAYNYGMNAVWSETDSVVAYEWSAILDDRTSPYCEEMDGEIFDKEDPTLTPPPAHFNCRSMLVPILSDEQYQVSSLNPEAPNGIERQFD